jgi:hypothetical protein
MEGDAVELADRVEEALAWVTPALVDTAEPVAFAPLAVAVREAVARYEEQKFSTSMRSLPTVAFFEAQHC